MVENRPAGLNPDERRISASSTSSLRDIDPTDAYLPDVGVGKSSRAGVDIVRQEREYNGKPLRKPSFS